MTKRIVSACALVAFALLPALSWGQNNNTNNPQKDKKTVIKNNKLDVIYPEDDYSGIVIDHKPLTQDDQSRIYYPPMILPPPPPEDEDQAMSKLYVSVEDEGVDSEDDILLATGDPEMVHSKKMDLNTFSDTLIHLVNHRSNQEFHFPTPEKAIVTSHFGPRRRRWHYGVDLGLAIGEPIYACFDGVVRYSN